MNNKLVRIDWTDPHSVDEWTDIDDPMLNTWKVITTFGKLVKETSGFYVVTLNYDHEDDKMSCTMVIPKNCVQRIETINDR